MDSYIWICYSYSITFVFSYWVGIQNWITKQTTMGHTQDTQKHHVFPFFKKRREGNTELWGRGKIRRNLREGGV